jgi:hypothetical protein
MLNGRDPKAGVIDYGNKYPAAYHVFKWSLVPVFQSDGWEMVSRDNLEVS